MDTPRMRAALLAALVVLTPVVADAALRQHYSAWMYHPGKQYFYRSYYYKPHADFTGYNYHYAIWSADDARYVYFYNPYKRSFWGRYDMQGQPGREYSLLAPKDCKESLKEIPATAFPAAGKMPAIPDSTDNVPIEPPRDLPKAPR